jgi:RNA polymerase sigma-70 factor, ECF subfamily
MSKGTAAGSDPGRPGPSPPFEPTDAELIERFRSGHADSFATLVSRHERRVYNLAYRMLGRSEDARDAAQEAFLSCYRHIASFRGEAAFTTWLHRITVNACYDALRKRPPDPSPLSEIPEPAPARDHADQAVAAVDVQRALLRIPPEFRGVLVLHDIQGLPYEDVAEALEIPLGTVKSRLHRGRVALARALAGEPDPDPGPSKPAAEEPFDPSSPHADAASGPRQAPLEDDR